MSSLVAVAGTALPVRPWQSAPARIPQIAPGELHELHAAGEDRAVALAFALGRGCARTGPLVVVRSHRRSRLPAGLYGEGLLLLGVDPARLVVVDAPDEVELLRAGLDAARSMEGGTVLLETEGRLPRYDLVASRRLVLAAERSRAGVIVLRHDAPVRASAAQARWAIRSAPSVPLEARAPGRPALEVELLRWRGGPAGQCWRLEWDEDHGRFAEAA